MIEKDFISELYFAVVMGHPTAGLVDSWPVTMVTAKEAEEFCRRRTEQELEDMRAEYESLMDEAAKDATGWNELRQCIDHLEDEIASMEHKPWRLPTSEEWEEEFKIKPFPHYLYGWTSTTESDLRIVRGGSWPHGPGFARASFRDGLDPGERSVSVGFRCAR